MDASKIFDLLNAGIRAALDFFSDLLSATGMLPYYTAFVAIFIIGRFLLKPLLGGSAGSDKVKKPKEDNDG